MQETPWRIAVLGAGAIGCRVAAHLAQVGVQCTLIDGWHDHVQAIRQHGLEFERGATTGTFLLPAYSLDDLPPGPFDVVLLAVRSDDTARMLPHARQLLAPNGFVVSCQNGLNEDAIAQALGQKQTLGCSLVLGARLAGPGHVVALPGPDTLKVGELDGSDTPRVRRLASLLGACGTASVTGNLLGYRWMKLVLNSIGNPLLLLSGLTAGELHQHEDIRRLMILMTGEILSVARASGVSPEPILEVPAEQWLVPSASHAEKLHATLAQHGKDLGPRRLSMVADFEARGRTEVDHINGYVVAKAASLGLSAPLNAEVVKLVKQLEAGDIRPSITTLDPLLAMAG